MKLSKRVLSAVKRAFEREVAAAERALRLLRKLKASRKGFQTKAKRAAANVMSLEGKRVACSEPAPRAPSAEANATTPTRAGSSGAKASAYGEVAAAVCTSTAAAAVAAVAAPQEQVNGRVITITLTGF